MCSTPQSIRGCVLLILLPPVCDSILAIFYHCSCGVLHFPVIPLPLGFTALFLPLERLIRAKLCGTIKVLNCASIFLIVSSSGLRHIPHNENLGPSGKFAARMALDGAGHLS